MRGVYPRDLLHDSLKSKVTIIMQVEDRARKLRGRTKEDAENDQSKDFGYSGER